MSTYDPHFENLKARRVLEQGEKQWAKRLEYREGMTFREKVELSNLLNGVHCIKCKSADPTDEYKFYCKRCKR